MYIRKARETDFAAILAIYNQAIPTKMMTADLDLATENSRRSWFDFHLNSEKYPIWTVEDEQGVAGWFTFSPFYPRAAFAPSAEISLYLDNRAKGRGYGSAIIEFMQQQMLDYGIHTLMAYVFEHNQPSRRLMEKYGFECWGRYPNIVDMNSGSDHPPQWQTFLMMAYQKGIETEHSA